MKRVIFLFILVSMLFMGCLEPSVNTNNGSNNTTVTVYDTAKVNRIVNVINDLIKLQGGNVQVQLKAVNKVNGLYVITLSTPDGNTQDIYATNDLEQIFLQPPIKVSDLEKTIEKFKQQNKEIPKTDKPTVQLYIMSFCPFGNQAEQLMNPIIHLLNDKISFEPVYIISNRNGQWTSLHGNSELKQDVREKIIFNMYGPVVWADYVKNVDHTCDVKDIDTCWKSVAENMSLNTTAIEETYNSSFDSIVSNEASKTNEAKVQGSPTLVINGVIYNERANGRSTNAYKSAICSAFTTEPIECNQTLNETSTNTPQGYC